MGGMRRSLKTNTLVLITNPSGLYNDRWENELFLYTGAGLKGNQELNSGNNKVLYKSNEKHIDIFLFEKVTKNQYKYIGKMVLAGQPFREIQKDIEGESRDVWMFPLRMIDTVDNRVEKNDQDRVNYYSLVNKNENNLPAIHTDTGSIEITGSEGLPFWSILYFFEKTVSNHMKLSIIESICELSASGAPDNSFAVATKSIDVFPDLNGKKEDFEDYVILETKSGSPKRFWELIEQLDRPEVLYINEYGFRIPLYNFASSEALRIISFSENSPFKAKAKGSISPLFELFSPKKKEHRQALAEFEMEERKLELIERRIGIEEKEIELRNKRLNVMRAEFELKKDLLDMVLTTTTKINDPKVSPPLQSHARKVMKSVVDTQDKLNDSIGLKDIYISR